jgi:hypothetical protein
MVPDAQIGGSWIKFIVAFTEIRIIGGRSSLSGKKQSAVHMGF